jgi:hypothetical protein
MSQNIIERIESIEKAVKGSPKVDIILYEDISKMKNDLAEIKRFLEESLGYTPRKIKHTR